eukprot:3847313-Rhodomonas_salina.4
MSGTELGYAATRQPHRSIAPCRPPYGETTGTKALSPYARGTKCPVLTRRMVLVVSLLPKKR